MGTMVNPGSPQPPTLASKLTQVDEEHSSSLRASELPTAPPPTPASQTSPSSQAPMPSPDITTSAASTLTLQAPPDRRQLDLIRRKSSILLEAWSTKAKAMRDSHFHQAVRYMRLHWTVGIPAVALSSALGTSIFATLQNPLMSAPVWAQLAIASLSVASAVLTACTAFLRFAERAEQHRQAASTFESLAQDIDATLALRSTDDMSNLHSQIERFRLRFDALQLGPTLQPEFGTVQRDHGDVVSSSDTGPRHSLTEFLEYLKAHDSKSYEEVLAATQEAAIRLAARIATEKNGLSTLAPSILPPTSSSPARVEQLVAQFTTTTRQS